MTIDNLDELFLSALKEMLYAERKIIRALTGMQRNASHPNLKAALSLHMGESEDHVLRLEEVFEALGKPARGTISDAMAGLLDDTENLIADVDKPEIMDAALISLTRAIEHYQIARYGTLVTWAAQLGHPKAAILLKETLNEERGADKALSKMATKRLNVVALA